MIFNELDYVNNMLNNGFIQNSYLLELKLLAKYYNKIEKLSKAKTKEKLKEFCKKYWVKYNEVKCLSIIEKAVNFGTNNVHHLFVDNNIKITKSEIESIKDLNDLKLEKIAFSILVLGKISKYKNNFNNKIKVDVENIKIENKINKHGIQIDKVKYATSDKYYINNIKDIFKYAKVNVKKVIQEEYLTKLSQHKIIKPTIIGAFEVNFINENDEMVLEFNADDNLIYEYLKYIGQCKSCVECGKAIQTTNNKMKYCNECAIEIEKENWAKRKRKQRDKMKCHEIEKSENT